MTERSSINWTIFERVKMVIQKRSCKLNREASPKRLHFRYKKDFFFIILYIILFFIYYIWVIFVLNQTRGKMRVWYFFSHKSHNEEGASFFIYLLQKIKQVLLKSKSLSLKTIRVLQRICAWHLTKVWFFFIALRWCEKSGRV